MDLDAQYVLTLRELLIVFGAGGVAAFLFALLCAAIGGLTKPSDHEQRLMQMQMDKEVGELEVYALTQDYLERVEMEAQNHRPPERREKDHPRLNR